MKTIPMLTATIALAAAAPALAQHDHQAIPTAPAPHAGSTPAAAPDTVPPEDHSATGHAPMAHASMGTMDMAGPAYADHMMWGALGTYPPTREASGTAWQPDASAHDGPHAMYGNWMLMAHGVLDAVYDHQSGPRGDADTFMSGMLMGMARRPVGDGTLQLRAMLSPDPLMGTRGYPLLLASGETANGVDPLIDRQHPHDFFMELSASLSHDLGSRESIFIYGGLPGEPAFGPPAFMHREAIMDSPEAPISHHWLDSTHITMGVVTAGLVIDRTKLEISRFNAREPDQHRWNIETGALDSTAARASWNPVDAVALQASWGRFKDPEQLEPGVDQERWSASAMYAHELAPGWRVAVTLAWGRKSVEHHGEHFHDDAYAVEASMKHDGWTLFGRGETTENRELTGATAGHDPAYQVGKVSLGAVRDFRIAEHLLVGAGGLVAVDFIPEPLRESYGGRHALGAMGFVRLKLD